ncbi:MAG: sorbosone dehydrogenase family protein [Methyloversatilis discipulorum]|uniref:PQQ-dependent sugar dehydrogenase n=1 Tax=Methyloversatilis discipulorum TaxID=1119528 RepID=UPI0026EF2947|nr:sorbosone dehydrogenase family protein [Methyloversatilis discipulorum]MBT9515629.1 sorbosone dehydrogenase family protein [Methyloversatilis discipulorum]
MTTMIRSLLLAGALAFGSALAHAETALEKLRVPPGFTIELWAQVDNPRAMTLGAPGRLYVGSRAGHVSAVTFDPATMKAGKAVRIADQLNMPVGVAWRKGDLYVSSLDRILKLPAIDDKLATPPKPVLVSDRFPKESAHGWKFIAFGPDDKLYVPVGAPCNICDRDKDGFANIMRMNADGSGLEIYARGVRNSVGFDWHPKTGELWFTDNGRDWMGDDTPPCELNRVSKAGQHFGYPYCHGGNIADPEFGKGRSCADYTPPVLRLGAHVAPLGMRFYTGSQFPDEYRGAVFIAEHGSWNRSVRDGYRVMVARLDGDTVTSYTPFVEGFLGRNDAVSGRPADVLVLPDGSLLVSDDASDAIYRVRWNGTRHAAR